jgi:hypothetical protein
MVLSCDMLDLGFKLGQARAEGAFLVPRGSRSISTTLRNTLNVEAFLCNNFEQIITEFELDREQEHRYPLLDRGLTILVGTTHTAGWCNGVSFRQSGVVEGSIGVNVYGLPVWDISAGHSVSEATVRRR